MLDSVVIDKISIETVFGIVVWYLVIKSVIKEFVDQVGDSVVACDDVVANDVNLVIWIDVVNCAIVFSVLNLVTEDRSADEAGSSSIDAVDIKDDSYLSIAIVVNIILSEWGEYFSLVVISESDVGFVLDFVEKSFLWFENFWEF